MLVEDTKKAKLLISYPLSKVAKWLKPLESRCQVGQIVHYQFQQSRINRYIAMNARVYDLRNFSYSDRHQSENRCSTLGAIKMKNGGCY